MHFVPGIVRRALDVVDTHDPSGELDRYRLAQHNHSGFAQLGGCGGIFRCNIFAERARPRGRGEPRDVEYVLHAVGYSVEWSGVSSCRDLFFSGPCFLKGTIRCDQVEGPERAVELFDTLKKALGQLYRRELARLYLAGKIGDGLEVQRQIAHGAPALASKLRASMNRQAEAEFA
jgi:hypothetical protein